MSIGATEPVSYTGMFGTAPTTGTDTGATTTTSKSADKDMFLQLLVAQMKYQDPMNPTDSSQFLAQSAQFTALEKMQAVADQTQQLVASQMAFGANRLGYFIYKDPAHATVWGNTIATGVAQTFTGIDGTPLTVYGAITAAQNVPVGAYVDTVVATVTF